MPASYPKSSTTIEIWLNEVSASTSSTAISQEVPEPPIHPPCFWKKILRRDPFKHSTLKAGRLKFKDGKAADLGLKTEMYGRQEKARKVMRDGGESHLVSKSRKSEKEGLEERGERLERGAKLLDGTGKATNMQGDKYD